MALTPNIEWRAADLELQAARAEERENWLSIMAMLYVKTAETARAQIPTHVYTEAVMPVPEDDNDYDDYAAWKSAIREGMMTT